jgi:hypothetical protein
MTKNKFSVVWVGYCEPLKKIWGWFGHVDDNSIQKSYCFWSHLGKTVCFKNYNRHTSKSHFDGIKDVKIKHGYIEIKVNDLVLIWPEFFNDLASDFLSDKLKEKI